MRLIRISQANIIIPSNRLPRSDTEYIRSVRLVNQQGSSNKEYVIRVYRYPDSYYSTIAFNGRIGGNFVIQPKYFGHNEGTAQAIATDLTIRKQNKGYRIATDDNRAPGIPSGPMLPPRTQNSNQSENNATTNLPSASIPPDIERFINEMAGTGTATMAGYMYSSARTSRNDNWVYELSEAIQGGSFLNPTRTMIFNSLGNSIRKAAEWAMERKEQQVISVPQEKTTNKNEESPVQDSEINPDAKEILDLLGESKTNWYKLASFGYHG